MIFNNIDEFCQYHIKCIVCDSNTELYYNTLDFNNLRASTKKLIIDNDYVILDSGTYDGEIINSHINIFNNHVKRACQTKTVFDAYNIFFKVGFPTIEMICSKCELYSYHSSLLEIEDKLLPFSILYERFNFGNFWVQNLLSEGVTKIYSTVNVNAPSIEIDLIDFHSMSIENLKNKFETIINFSS